MSICLERKISERRAVLFISAALHSAQVEFDVRLHLIYYSIYHIHYFNINYV